MALQALEIIRIGNKLRKRTKKKLEQIIIEFSNDFNTILHFILYEYFYRNAVSNIFDHLYHCSTLESWSNDEKAVHKIHLP